jgi:hypothetical protein
MRVACFEGLLYVVCIHNPEVKCPNGVVEERKSSRSLFLGDDDFKWL